MLSHNRKGTDMKRLFTGGRVLRADHTFEDNCPVLIEDDKILAVGADCNNYVADQTEELVGLTVLPGLVDVHTHGRAGFDFNDATEEEMRLMRTDYARHGVTSVMATLASDTKEG